MSRATEKDLHEILHVLADAAEDLELSGLHESVRLLARTIEEHPLDEIARCVGFEVKIYCINHDSQHADLVKCRCGVEWPLCMHCRPLSTELPLRYCPACDDRGRFPTTGRVPRGRRRR